jgi:hypothetical protein
MKTFSLLTSLGIALAAFVAAPSALHAGGNAVVVAPRPVFVSPVTVVQPVRVIQPIRVVQPLRVVQPVRVVTPVRVVRPVRVVTTRPVCRPVVRVGFGVCR